MYLTMLWRLALQMQLRNMQQQQQQQAAHLHAQRMMQAHQQQLAMAHQAQHRSMAPGAGMAHAGLPASAYRGSFANAASQASPTYQQLLRGAIVTHKKKGRAFLRSGDAETLQLLLHAAFLAHW